MPWKNVKVSWRNDVSGVRALEVIVGVFGGHGLDLPCKAEHVAEDHQRALEVEG